MNCPLQYCIEGNYRRKYISDGKKKKKRRNQVLEDLKEKRSYWNVKEEALDRTQWRTRFGRGCGPVV
jgi:hypothetical protein